MRLEAGVIGLDRGQHVARRGRPAKFRRPRPLPRGGLHQPVAGFRQVVGHLHRQHATRGQRSGKLLEHAQVIWHPLEGGIGEQQVRLLRRQPDGQVAEGEVGAGAVDPRCLQHGGRIVDPRHTRLRKARDQHGRRVARPAAQVIDTPGGRQMNMRQQVPRRPCPLIREGQIRVGLPIAHGRSVTRKGAARAPVLWHKPSNGLIGQAHA